MIRDKVLHVLALFTSAGTLLCCALPALLILMAGGAAMSSFLSVFPWVIPLSRNKEWVFLLAGALLIVSCILIFKPKGSLACALTGGKGCEMAGRFNQLIFFVSLVFYLAGGFVAYALVPILQWFEK